MEGGKREGMPVEYSGFRVTGMIEGFFFGGGGGGEICPCNSTIASPRFEVYKTFLCVFMRNFMVFMR